MQIKALKRARLAISLLACAALIEGSVSGFARADTGQADPTYWWGGKKWLSEGNLNVVKTTVGLSSFIGMAGAAALTGLAIAVCDIAGKGIWVYWTWAGQVWCTGP